MSAALGTPLNVVSSGSGLDCKARAGSSVGFGRGASVRGAGSLRGVTPGGVSTDCRKGGGFTDDVMGVRSGVGAGQGLTAILLWEAAGGINPCVVGAGEGARRGVTAV